MRLQKPSAMQAEVISEIAKVIDGTSGLTQLALVLLLGVLAYIVVKRHWIKEDRDKREERERRELRENNEKQAHQQAAEAHNKILSELGEQRGEIKGMNTRMEAIETKQNDMYKIVIQLQADTNAKEKHQR